MKALYLKTIYLFSFLLFLLSSQSVYAGPVFQEPQDQLLLAGLLLGAFAIYAIQIGFGIFCILIGIYFFIKKSKDKKAGIIFIIIGIAILVYLIFEPFSSEISAFKNRREEMKLAESTEFSLFIPSYLPSGSLKDITFRNFSDENNPYLQMEFTGSDAILRMYEYDITKTKNVGDNCEPLYPESPGIEDNKCAQVAIIQSLGIPIYMTGSETRTLYIGGKETVVPNQFRDTYVTIGKTRIAVHNSQLSEEEIIKIFSSLRQISFDELYSLQED